MAQEFIRDPSRLLKLDPEEWEDLITECLKRRLNWAAARTGPVNRKDGGIDIIATPKGAPILIAVQAKHHDSFESKTGPAPVREMAGYQNSSFRLGLVVTNTGFTEDAIHAAKLAPNFLKLRDGEDLQRWLKGDLSQESREIPSSIELASGVHFPMHLLDSGIVIEVQPAHSSQTVPPPEVLDYPYGSQEAMGED